jgi:hypothetical protein
MGFSLGHVQRGMQSLNIRPQQDSAAQAWMAQAAQAHEFITNQYFYSCFISVLYLQIL